MALRLPPRLLALSPGDLPEGQGRGLLERLRAACAAGLKGVLLREPCWRDAPLLELALEAREVLDHGDAPGWLGVHDRAHVARAAGADGLHLGFRSLRIQQARELVGPTLALGLSTHAADPEEDWVGADYLFHGPVHATPSKEGVLEPLGIAGLGSAVLRAGGTPVLGLGGLEPEHGPAVLSSGAFGVAAIRGWLAHADSAARVRAYLKELGE